MKEQVGIFYSIIHIHHYPIMRQYKSHIPTLNIHLQNNLQWLLYPNDFFIKLSPPEAQVYIILNYNN